MNQCVGYYDNVDKYFFVLDFYFDFGFVNDLVIILDFFLVNLVIDMGIDAVEDCSEGYSIVNVVLEGGGMLFK